MCKTTFFHPAPLHQFLFDRYHYFTHDLIEPVKQSPSEIMCSNPMPDSAYTKSDQQIDPFSDFPPTVSSKRNIDIIPQKATERNMPSAPEVFHGNCKIWMIKVLGQPDT